MEGPIPVEEDRPTPPNPPIQNPDPNPNPDPPNAAPPDPSQQPPQPPPAAAPPAAAAPPLPQINKKRPLDNYGPIQECSYFKMRAVLRDVKPHFLEILQTMDFQSCKGALELQEKLKLLIELYKKVTGEKDNVTKMTEEKDNVTKCTNAPNPSENGPGQKPQEQLQEPADQSQPDQIFAKASEKQQAEHGENQGTHIVGGSAFGWNFITFSSNAPIYYGRTKDSFRAAQVKS